VTTKIKDNAPREGFATAELFYCDCRLIREFIEGVVWPIVRRECASTPSPERQTYSGILERAMAWLRTIDRLNQPTDVQAHAAGARSLFELSIDLTLLRFGPQQHTHEMLISWEESSYLAQADRLQRCRSVPQFLQVAPVRWAAAKRDQVIASRQRLWPPKDPTKKAGHPQRWTGRPFDRDVEVANGLQPTRGFDVLYATTYSFLCWNTHGSALAGLRPFEASDIGAVSSNALAICASCALDAADDVLGLLGVPDAETLEAHEQLLRDRAKLGANFAAERG
jgi:hypothetical protein